MTLNQPILIEAIDTSLFLLPELPGRVEWLKIPGLQGRMIAGSDPFVGMVGASRLTANNANQTFQQVVDLYASQEQAFGWVVGPLSTPAGLGGRLVHSGLEKDLELAGMVHTRLDIPIPTNPEVTVRAMTPADLEAAVQVLAPAIGYTLEGARATVEALALSPSLIRRRTYLAFVDDAAGPVAYASMIYLPDQPIVVLFCAGTLEAYRGRGIYTSLVARRLADAYRDGVQAAIIQAVRTTSAPICQKLGFVELCNLDWYIGGNEIRE